MRQYNLYEAKTQLSQLVQAALDGEEVLIARAGKVAVRLVPVASAQPATGGWGTLSCTSACIHPASLSLAMFEKKQQLHGRIFKNSHFVISVNPTAMI